MVRLARRALAALVYPTIGIWIFLLVTLLISIAPARGDRPLGASVPDAIMLQRRVSSSTDLPKTTVTDPPELTGPSVMAELPAQAVPVQAVPGWGCAAAFSYLALHAAPGFVASCPTDTGGYQATTECVGAPDCQPGTEFIWIADPCPAAYMNEASNSWVLIGESSAPFDPYGYCGEPGNLYG